MHFLYIFGFLIMMHILNLCELGTGKRKSMQL